VIMYLLSALISAVLLASYSTLPASSGPWFRNATGLYDEVPTVKMALPDYLPGASMMSVCRAYGNGGAFLANSTWELLAYDMANRLFLAGGHNDQCGIALFALRPPFTVPGTVRRADLSGYHSARGIRIGSSYADVRRLYGGPARSGSSHFRVRYSADIPALRTPPRSVLDRGTSETVTLTFDDGRVSAIVVRIAENA